jgi:hypothetical protein
MKFFFVRTAEVDYNYTLLDAGHVLTQTGAGPDNRAGGKSGGSNLDLKNTRRSGLE